MSSESENKFYFDEPRLRMTLAGRMFVRVVGYVAYLVVLAAAVVSLISDLRWLNWTGIFLLLFLLDRLAHWREADKPLTEIPEKGEINFASYLEPDAYGVVERAFEKSRMLKADFFLAAAKELLNCEEIVASLKRLGVKPEEVKQKTEEFLEKSEGAADLFKQAEVLVVGAGGQALNLNQKFIGTGDLFLVLFSVENQYLSRIFSMFSIAEDDMGIALIFGSVETDFWKRRSLPLSLSGFRQEMHFGLHHRIMNRAWTSRPTPTLDRFGVDFTDLARGGYIGFMVGHQKEYTHLTDVLARPVSPNALLVGEPGVGKETIVAHLAFNIIQDSVPASLFDKRLVALSISDLVAGAAPEELQQRLQKIVSEIFAAENLILYIPDIHNLVKTSGTAYLSAADALLPIIKNNAFPVVGSSYPREYKEYLEPRSDFGEVFETIEVQEVTEEEAKKLLVYQSLLLEKETKIAVSFAAVKTAVSLAKKYFHQKLLPASAEELLKAGLTIAARKEKKFLEEDDVVKAAEEKSDIPIHKASADEAQALLNLEDSIHQRMIDQDEAVKAVSNALREYRSGLSRPGGPIASFLFVGPTGVGKTELAKTLAEINFGSEKMMIRFDMSEYQDKESFTRFIGSPDGKVKGELTEAVLQKPYSLILLDEFEKAYPDVWNLFLQVLDDGRLTDNLERVIDFQNTIIIATSNAHSDIINESLSKGESMEDIAAYLKSRLTDVFKPELLNRFSKIVVFHELSADDIRKIAVLNLNGLAKEVSNKGISLSFDDSAVKEISRLGYDPSFGARPLRRAIEDNIKNLLAEKILGGEISRGAGVQISFNGKDFQFNPLQS